LTSGLISPSFQLLTAQNLGVRPINEGNEQTGRWAALLEAERSAAEGTATEGTSRSRREDLDSAATAGYTAGSGLPLVGCPGGGNAPRRLRYAARRRIRGVHGRWGGMFGGGGTHRRAASGTNSVGFGGPKGENRDRRAIEHDDTISTWMICSLLVSMGCKWANSRPGSTLAARAC
jgi:hypothetical protein